MKTLKGMSANPGKAKGIARVITNREEAEGMQEGEILVAKETDQWHVVALNAAAAVVTEVNGEESHAAQIAQKLGIPAVVGVAEVTELIKTGFSLRVDGNKGEVTILSEKVHQRQV